MENEKKIGASKMGLGASCPSLLASEIRSLVGLPVLCSQHQEHSRSLYFVSEGMNDCMAEFVSGCSLIRLGSAEDQSSISFPHPCSVLLPFSYIHLLQSCMVLCFYLFVSLLFIFHLFMCVFFNVNII